jgi:hypothetical protein
MPATLETPSPLEAVCHVVGIVKCQRHHDASCLIGQIKLTRIHVASLFLPGVRVKRNKKPSLYNVERSANQFFAEPISKLCLFAFHTQCTLGCCSHREPAPRCMAAPTGKPGRLHHFKEMVEPDGIEPTTSCLQSRRSPS